MKKIYTAVGRTGNEATANVPGSIGREGAIHTIEGEVGLAVVCSTEVGLLGKWLRGGAVGVRWEEVGREGVREKDGGEEREREVR